MSLLKWYRLIYHMAMNKVGVSIAEMQRILEIGSCQTAWLMAHKIRKAMGNRDVRYRLAGLVEIEKFFFALEGLHVEVEAKISQPFCAPDLCTRTERGRNRRRSSAYGGDSK